MTIFKIIAYALAICGLLQFWIIPGIAWNFTFPYLQIIILGLCYTWRKKKPLQFLVVGIIGLATLGEFMFSAYSKTQISASQIEQELDVMTYNIYFQNRYPNQVLALIQEKDPDILCLQELSPRWAGILDKEIGASYPYKLTLPSNDPYGIGIYSKFKLENQTILKTEYAIPFAQIVDVKVGDKSMQLIHCHLSSPAVALANSNQFISYYHKNYKERRQQVLEINKVAQAGDNSYDSQLLLGDLNTLHSEPMFKTIRSNWASPGHGILRWLNFSFPNTDRSMPLMPLDYIMGRGRLQFLNYQTVKGGSSDHLPVLSRIKI